MEYWTSHISMQDAYWNLKTWSKNQLWVCLDQFPTVKNSQSTMIGEIRQEIAPSDNTKDIESDLEESILTCFHLTWQKPLVTKPVWLCRSVFCKTHQPIKLLSRTLLYLKIFCFSVLCQYSMRHLPLEWNARSSWKWTQKPSVQWQNKLCRTTKLQTVGKVK